jgi:hypothetical protein
VHQTRPPLEPRTALEPRSCEGSRTPLRPAQALEPERPLSRSKLASSTPTGRALHAREDAAGRGERRSAVLAHPAAPSDARELALDRAPRPICERRRAHPRMPARGESPSAASTPAESLCASSIPQGPSERRSAGQPGPARRPRLHRGGRDRAGLSSGSVWRPSARYRRPSTSLAASPLRSRRAKGGPDSPASSDHR